MQRITRTETNSDGSTEVTSDVYAVAPEVWTEMLLKSEDMAHMWDKVQLVRERFPHKGDRQAHNVDCLP